MGERGMQHASIDEKYAKAQELHKILATKPNGRDNLRD
jgi:hypothetical protein